MPCKSHHRGDRGSVPRRILVVLARRGAPWYTDINAPVWVALAEGRYGQVTGYSGEHRSPKQGGWKCWT
jgi:hypothetical protein